MFLFFQAEDGIRDLVRSRGLGDVYKRQPQFTGDLWSTKTETMIDSQIPLIILEGTNESYTGMSETCLLYTSDAADERSSVDLGGRRLIKKKNNVQKKKTKNS